MFKEVITLSVLLLASLALAAETTAKPTPEPTTVKPTDAPTTKVTPEPTEATPSSTAKPTPEPTTVKPTEGPTTVKPTPGPTTAPGPVAECEQLTLDGCGGKFTFQVDFLLNHDVFF